MKMGKQPNMVRGNRISCANYKQCPMCYGCRNYDDRDPECIECYIDGIDGTSRNFNVCDTNKHEAWKLNVMITKPCVEFENITFINGDEHDN